MTTPTQTLVALVRETAHYVQSPAERERLLAAAEAVSVIAGVEPCAWFITYADQSFGLAFPDEIEDAMGDALPGATCRGLYLASDFTWTRAASDQVRDLHEANNALLERARKAEEDNRIYRVASGSPFQARVAQWMLDCFTPEIAADRLERNDRFIEEALELTQASGYSRERAHALVDYVFDRPQGEINQEVGGVMVTLAAHCLAHGVDMMAGAETELARICDPTVMAKIRAKQAAKPTGSALPVPVEG